MNQRGEVEIVINARWVERSFFLLIIAALAAVLVWQYSQTSAESDATSLARIAELETSLATKEDEAAALRLSVASLEAENEDLKEQTQTPAAPAPTTPAPSTPVILNAAWEFSGEELTGNKYRLETITVFVTNTRATDATLTYAICWSLLDCETAVSRGTIEAPAGEDTEHAVELSIPRTVQLPQRLKIVVSEGSRVIFTNERTIA
jgi:cell division protein FtsB